MSVLFRVLNIVLFQHNMVTERQLCFITKVSWYGLYRATICVFCGLFFVNHSLMLGLSKSSGLWKEAKIGVLFMRE